MWMPVPYEYAEEEIEVNNIRLAGASLRRLAAIQPSSSELSLPGKT
jgi:hypothetical protein